MRIGLEIRPPGVRYRRAALHVRSGSDRLGCVLESQLCAILRFWIGHFRCCCNIGALVCPHGSEMGNVFDVI